MIKATAQDTFWRNAELSAEAYPEITIGSFHLNNLVPVTFGNVVGGAVLVGIVYWFVYLNGTTRLEDKVRAIECNTQDSSDTFTLMQLPSSPS